MKKLFIITALLSGLSMPLMHAVGNPLSIQKGSLKPVVHRTTENLTSLAPEANAADIEKLAEEIADFITMEQKHKTAWSNHTKAYDEAKFDLGNKHFLDVTNLAKESILELGKTGNVEEYLENKLTGMKKLHEEHIEEWHTLEEQWKSKGTLLYGTEKSELADFEKSHK